MGCGQSKIENEEAVTRCRDRKQFMKDAVSARNAFAAAHSAYAMSLKNTGAALSDYAHGEVQNAHSPPVVSTTEGVPMPPPPPPQSHFELEPPPPPPPNSTFDASPLHRAVSMPEMMMPENKKLGGPSTIIEEEDDGDDEVEAEENEKLVSRRRRGYKGSGSVGGSSTRGRERLESDPSPISASPPVVESRAAAMQAPQSSHGWEEYIFPPQENMVGPNLGTVEEEEPPKQQQVFDERPKRGEEVFEEVRKNAKVETAPVEKVPMEVPLPPTGGGSVGKGVKKGKSSVGAASGGGERRLGKGSVNLLQIFEQLDDHFLKASESAHEVSKMLEATRLHYHSNFADNRGNDMRLTDQCCYVER